MLHYNMLLCFRRITIIMNIIITMIIIVVIAQHPGGRGGSASPGARTCTGCGSSGLDLLAYA